MGQKFRRYHSSSTVFKIQAFLKKNQKFKMAAMFWQVKYSLKLGKASLHRYPVGQKFCRNRSIWHGFRHTIIFMFSDFCEKFDNTKWLPFMAGQNFFENCVSYSEDLLCGTKISSKSLYLAQFSRYKNFCVLHFCEKFENSKWPHALFAK